MIRQRFATFVLAVLLAVASAQLLSACEDHRKGPAQRAGDKIDDSVDKLKDTVDPKGPAEKAGRAVDRAAGTHD